MSKLSLYEGNCKKNQPDPYCLQLNYQICDSFLRCLPGYRVSDKFELCSVLTDLHPSAHTLIFLFSHVDSQFNSDQLVRVELNFNSKRLVGLLLLKFGKTLECEGVKSISAIFINCMSCSISSELQLSMVLSLKRKISFSCESC